RQALRRSRIADIELVHVPNLASAEGALRERSANAKIDALLLDLSLPDSEGLATVRRVQGLDSDMPIVVLTGQNDAALGLSALHEGAQDYLIKGETDGRLLDRALRYAIERQAFQAQGRLLEHERTARTLAEEALHERDEFLSVAAHELYTPITALHLS